MLRRRLRQALSRPEIREGLFLVSGDFFREMAGAAREPESDQAIGAALAEQLVRLATVVEFSGLQMAPLTGEIARATRLRLGALSSRHSQVDIEFLTAAAEAAAQLPSVRRGLRFFNNSTLYRVHGKARCLTSNGDGPAREYRSMTMELTPHLEAIIQRAEGGASLDELTSALVSLDPEVSRDEAASYVAELVDEQVLMPELAAAVTGADALGDLAEILESFPEAHTISRSLDRAREGIGQIDWEPFSGQAPRYPEIAKLLSMSNASRPLFRVRVFRTAASPSLSAEIAAEILRGAQVLASLERPHDRIQKFTESFFARYGESVVPLVEALDQQYGIGFEGSGAASEPLLGGLDFARPAESGAGFGTRERLLYPKLEEAWTTGSRVLTLTSEELASIAARDALPLPDSFAVPGAISAPSEAALDAGEYSFRIDRVTGPPGLAPLAPFCTSDPQLKERVERHLRAEESLRPEATFAEIISFPHPGDRHLLVRPRLRQREISYLGLSSADPEHRIPVTDLRLSIVAERIRLTSQRLGCELIPRLTATHDFFDSKNPPIYRFLCALQNQGTAARLQWSWGALAGAAFLPRVVCGKLVLCRARWVVGGKAIQDFERPQAVDRFRALCKIRERLGLPRFVETGEGLRRSVFDLENVLSAESLIQRIRTERSASVVEMFPTPDSLCTLGPQGRYAHEITVPFLRDRSGTPVIARAPRPAVHRFFPPGSEWLQVNLYSAPAVLEEVLREVVSPATRRALASGAVEHWHFMRYADPGFHLRLRLHGDKERLISEVWPEIRSFAAALLEDRRVFGVKLDTYHRDVGRFGGDEGMVAAEEIFWADSEAVLSILGELSDAELNEARWRLALIGFDMMLSDLGLSRVQKISALKTARDDLAARLKAHATLEGQIARRYQSEAASLRQLFASKPEPGSALARGLAVLRRRSQSLKGPCAELVKLERTGRLSRSIADQAYSQIHMFANRFFPAAGLAQELMLDDFLHRLHSGS
jgi:thiopeptide-type bacteriocin biosynthesis protein